MLKFPVYWASEKVPSVEDVEKIYTELDHVFDSLEKAEDLIFHTIFIGDGHDGPIVMAYGKSGDAQVYLDFIPEMEWISLRGDNE